MKVYYDVDPRTVAAEVEGDCTVDPSACKPAAAAEGDCTSPNCDQSAR